MPVGSSSEHVCHLGISLLKTLCGVAMVKVDLRKVFLGQLHGHVIKPQVVTWLLGNRLWPPEVYIPKSAGPLGIGFAVFATEAEALQCTLLNDCICEELSPSKVKATRTKMHGSF